jgi:hypothetical protein
MDMLAFIVRGTLASSLASLLALRAHGWLAVMLLTAIGALVLTAADARMRTARLLRSLTFGVAWMAAAYALQAIARTNTGYGDAMTFRYTYLGMTGAAFTVAALMQPLAEAWRPSRQALRRGLVAACLVATVAGVTFNAGAFAARSDAHEREYYDINRQYFATTHAALLWADARQVLPPDGLVPKTIFPGVENATPLALTETYRKVVCYLADCTRRADVRDTSSTAAQPPPAVWDVLLFP